MPLKNDLKHGETGSASTNRALVLSAYTVATAPAAADYEGRLIYVSDGAAGSPCVAYSNGVSWLRISLGAAIAVI